MTGFFRGGTWREVICLLSDHCHYRLRDGGHVVRRSLNGLVQGLEVRESVVERQLLSVKSLPQGMFLEPREFALFIQREGNAVEVVAFSEPMNFRFFVGRAEITGTEHELTIALGNRRRVFEYCRSPNGVMSLSWANPDGFTSAATLVDALRHL